MIAASGLPATGSDIKWARRGGLQLALVAAVVSGVAIYVNGLAVRRFPSPTVYTTGKNIIAGAALVVIATIAARRDRDVTTGATAASIDRRGAAGLGIVAVIGGTVPFVLFFEGLARATSSDAAFIHKTLVVWVALLAVGVLRERITIVHLGAVGLLVAAQVALADGVGSLRPGVGEAMVFAATLCWSVELIVVKKLVESVHPTVVAASRIAGGAVLLVIWLSITGRLASLTTLSASQWAWLLLTGSVLSVFVSVLFAAIARAQVIDVAAVLVLGAVITGLLELAAGGAVVPVELLGWVLILAATAVLVAQQVLAERRRAFA